jgi:hypothetical protein
MTIDSWQAFFEAVEAMRDIQKKYDRTKSPGAKLALKRLEKIIDDFIDERNKRIAQKAQPDMFEGNNGN